MFSETNAARTGRPGALLLEPVSLSYNPAMRLRPGLLGNKRCSANSTVGLA